ncbi:TonB-dependent siderophore receptor [Aerosakkonema funiforme]|uniref:TonB-dependent siderophore receptor n=1 Tax=Aerosakkonema funiforme FACHB-1375 TaxID=2949571 RepID=A0A926ZHN9_9CYAN|nr:TonB-dependent siderophore receptor [Aerosakkonema funiforme]MBD2183503.1 TonB-dependent siderophore receptor [Aerosakkonema funiforme FACHB-1375]
MKQLQFLNALGFAGAVSVLVAAPAKAQIAQVTAVKLNPTPNGIEVILETIDGKPLQAFTGKYGETFFADIITAQLRLPEGDSFRQDNPAPGIRSIEVTRLDINSIRVKVIGAADVPTAQVTSQNRGLVVSLNTASGTATQPTSPTREPVTQVQPTQPTSPTGEPVTQVQPTQPTSPTRESVTQVQPTQPTSPTREPVTQVQPTQPTSPTGESVTQVQPTQPTSPTGEPVTQVQPTQPTSPTGEPVTQVQPTQPTSPRVQPPRERSVELIVIAEADETGYRAPSATAGTRTDTPLRDVPQAVQVVPQQVLEDRQVTRVEEAVRSTSGVNPTSSSISTFETFNIRGFESTNILRNGLRDSTNTQIPSETANLERLEVLKGPASVLFGQGSPGGVINLVTKRPLPDPFYAAEFSIGNFSFYRGAIDLSGPLNRSRNSLYRFNASYENSNTFVDFTQIERLFFAPVVSWDITEDTKLTLEGEFIRSSFPNYRGLPAVGTVLPNPNGKIPIERNIAEPNRDFIDNNANRLGYNLEHRFSENWSLRNSFRVTLFSYEQDSFFPNSLEPDNRTLTRGYSTGSSGTDNEIMATDLIGNFSTGPIDHKLLVGVELFRENNYKNKFDFGDIAPLDLFNPVYGSPNGEITFSLDNATLTRSAGFYVQDRISIFDKFKLILGGRFDFYEQQLTDKLANTETKQSEESFSPRVGIVYQPIEPISLYASFSRSFNPVIGTGFNNELFKPETGTQYEVGVKADLLDGRLSSTFAIYQLTRQNVLTPDPRDANFSIQTGEQRSRGVELDVTGEILPGLKVIASYAYTDATITEDNALPVGNRLDNVPKHSAGLFATYELQRGNLRGLGFGLGFFYVGERPGDLDNSFYLPDYFRTDAALYYRRDNFKVGLNVKNLFDIRYYEASNGPLRVFPGAPLTVQATIGLEF